MRNVWRGSLVALVGLLAACSSAETMSSLSDSSRNAGSNGGASPTEGAGKGAPTASGEGEPGAAGDPSTDPAKSPSPVSDTLTAGVWDDNLNFDFFTKYITTLGARPGLPIFSASERTAAKDRAFAPRTATTELDVAFLVDTTGSMQDELSYIQKELSSIAGNIATRFPGTTPRFGLVFYRDQGDQYVTRWFDFATDLQTVQANLDAQTTGGGGDYPEAVPDGLSKTMTLSWRQGNVARLAFWVADAPAHGNEGPATRSAIDAALQQSVHVYPVAASGADELTEATMRSTAQITGGRYLFLTDDSGVGGAHKEPSIPCYHVTKFSSAMVRMVEGEMKGTRIEPQTTEILRSVGNPQDGKCTLASQEQVVIY